MHPQLGNMCTHGEGNGFYTKRFTFGGGRAVMELETSFLGSRLPLQCIFY